MLLVMLLVFSSCKSSRNIVKNTIVTKKLSARKVSKKHIANSFDKKTIDAKLKVAYRNDKEKYNLTVKLRIDKDKLIWINVVYKGLILVARAKITPTSVSYYEKINKTYFKGNFELLKNILGTEVDFFQLQNMLLGQTIFDLKAQKYKSVVDQNSHLLSPVKQKSLFNILFWINPSHYKLDKQELRSVEKNQTLKVEYKSYTLIDGETFPKRIDIRAVGKQKLTTIKMDYKTVVFNKKISTPFRIPNGYKQVAF